MNKIKCMAFDCFGTVFDMSGVSREEIKAYVEHVRQNDFTPYEFPNSWWHLQVHPDAAEGIAKIQALGIKCVTLSNGAVNLLHHVSVFGRIRWNRMIDLAKYRVYKPHIDAYRTVEKDLGYKPEETLMVTANPTFGDVEGAAAIGMHSQVIRQPDCPQTIIALAGMYGA